MIYTDTRTGDVYDIDYSQPEINPGGGLRPRCRHNGQDVTVERMTTLLSRMFGSWPWSNPNPPGMFASAMEERIVALEREVRNLKGYGDDPTQGPAYISSVQHAETVRQYQRWATHGKFHADV